MNIPADHVGRKTTREVRPYDLAARLFCARPAEAGFTYRQTGAWAWPGAHNSKESSGGGSKGTVIWGIPV